MNERSACLSLYSTSTEKLGMSKNSGHCLLSEGDDPAVDKISVSTVLQSDSSVGENREDISRVTKGITFSVALLGKSVI